MQAMSKAQECLIKCLRLSGMTIAQISEIVEMLWEEDVTIEMLQKLTESPTLDHKKLYSIALEISKKRRQLNGIL